MKEIGKIGGYVIYWEAMSGAVYVGDERATDSDGSPAIAYSEARAMEVARDYIRRSLGG